MTVLYCPVVKVSQNLGPTYVLLKDTKTSRASIFDALTLSHSVTPWFIAIPLIMNSNHNWIVGWCVIEITMLNTDLNTFWISVQVTKCKLLITEHQTFGWKKNPLVP